MLFAVSSRSPIAASLVGELGGTPLCACDTVLALRSPSRLAHDTCMWPWDTLFLWVTGKWKS